MMRIANNLESSSETLVAVFVPCWLMPSVGLFDSLLRDTIFCSLYNAFGRLQTYSTR